LNDTMIDTILHISFDDFQTWDWGRIAPYFEALEAAPLTSDTIIAWLNARARLENLLNEREQRLEVATTLDTADTQAEARHFTFLETVKQSAETADQRLKQKLLSSGIEPDGYATVLRNLRAAAALYRDSNIPLLTDDEKLINEYGKITGAQTVQWDGEERTLTQLMPYLYEQDAALRERAWRARAERALVDRAALNDLYGRMVTLRDRIAHNADLPDYRAYQWQEMSRFDYTPDDCRRFHDAIEAEVVPAARQLLEKRRARLGTPTLRPWDTDVDPLGRTPLRPFADSAALIDRSEAIFRGVDPQLGAYFADMRAHDLLDLDNRKGKGPGGYCTDFRVMRKPFIFMNAVGLHNDVQTMLHEGGHAFHTYEVMQLDEYRRSTEAPIEFCEVASMSMELLAAPYLSEAHGGFYSADDAARARVEHLENLIFFLPYMACVDAFQHWSYTHIADALDPAQCDAQWGALWDRFMTGIDYSGLEDVRVTGWQRKMHIFQVPLYYVEYGIAQVGAVQVWLNAQQDYAGTVAAYRRALALGGTEPLPRLFEAAGIRFAMDAPMLKMETEAIMRTLDQLDLA